MLDPWQIAGTIAVFGVGIATTNMLLGEELRRFYRPLRLILWVLFAALVIAATAVILMYPRPQAIASAPVAPPLLAEHFQELKDIDNFVGSTDEASLRTTFDLPKMARMNILIAREWAGRTAGTTSVTRKESQEIKDFVKVASIAMDGRYVTFKPPPPGSIVREAQISPDHFCCLYSSPEYLASLRRLRRYEASATVPNDVKIALKRLDNTVSYDVAIIPEVINVFYDQNHELLMHDGDMKSLYFGQVTAAYANRISPLRPKAADISSAIRRYLRVN